MLEVKIGVEMHKYILHRWGIIGNTYLRAMKNGTKKVGIEMAGSQVGVLSVSMRDGWEHTS